MKFIAPLLSFIFLNFFQCSLYAQEDKPLKFYEVIKDDSVRMFCTDDGNFTERECADFIRYTRVDSAGNFIGYFKDLDHDNNVFCTGYYFHNERNGYFETFYPFGGSIRSRGSYVNNIPAGPWEYFYENGLPERTLMVTETDTLLVKFVDQNGEVKVAEGNGDFAGLVAGNAGISYNKFFATGKIQNGKPKGKWIATFKKMTYCEEVFEQGKLVKGIFPYAKLGANKTYNNKSYLNTFFLNDHLYNLEGFTSVSCDGDQSFPGMYFIAFNPRYFSTHLRKRIASIVHNDFNEGNTNLYPVGDNSLSIQFDINALGSADNFVVLTSWGKQFLKVISANIKGRVKFRAGYKTLYFHLNMHVDEDHQFKYDFRFSKAK